MTTLDTLARRLAAVDGEHRDAIYTLCRETMRVRLDLDKLLALAGLTAATDAEVDAALNEEN